MRKNGLSCLDCDEGCRTVYESFVTWQSLQIILRGCACYVLGAGQGYEHPYPLAIRRYYYMPGHSAACQTLAYLVSSTPGVSEAA